MSNETIMLIAAASAALVGLGAFHVGRIVFQKTVPPGMALVVTPKSGNATVSFTNALVVPGFHHATFVDITVKLLKVERAKTNPLLSRDEQPFRAAFTFYLRVSKTEDGVLHVTQSFGENPLDPIKLRERFLPKFDEALDTVAAAMAGDDLLQRRQMFKDEVLKVIGCDLNGLSLDDMAIDELVRVDR